MVKRKYRKKRAPSPRVYISPTPAPTTVEECENIWKCYMWLKHLVEKELEELKDYVARRLADKGVYVEKDVSKGFWVVVEPERLKKEELKEALEKYVEEREKLEEEGKI